MLTEKEEGVWSGNEQPREEPLTAFVQTACEIPVLAAPGSAVQTDYKKPLLLLYCCIQPEPYVHIRAL